MPLQAPAWGPYPAFSPRIWVLFRPVGQSRGQHSATNYLSPHYAALVLRYSWIGDKRRWATRRGFVGPENIVGIDIAHLMSHQGFVYFLSIMGLQFRICVEMQDAKIAPRRNCRWHFRRRGGQILQTVWQSQQPAGRTTHGWACLVMREGSRARKRVDPSLGPLKTEGTKGAALDLPVHRLHFGFSVLLVSMRYVAWTAGPVVGGSNHRRKGP